MEYQNRRDLKTFAQILFWMAFLLLLVAIPNVLAITGEINAPNSVLEGNLLQIDFTSDDPNASLALHKDGSPVTNLPPYEWYTNTQDAGLYQFSLYGDTTLLDQKTIEVIDKPLSFTINEPSATEYAQSTIPLSLETTSLVDFCYYVIGAESNTLDANGNTHTGELTRPDGIYTVALKCKSGAEVSTQEKTLLIDTTPPGIISSSPAPGATLEGTDATITITTNEVADCTIKESSGAVEKAMTTIDHVTHSHTFNPGEGNTNVFVTCTDMYGNTNQPTQFSFTLDQKPSARITIEGLEDEERPLTAGSYPLTLTASEPIQEPSLQYKYQTGGGGTIALSKDDESGTVWRGYLVLAESVGEKAANFVVSLKDNDGNVGTLITEGKLFLVDTGAPPLVEGLRVTQESDEKKTWLQLTWVDDFSEEISFRIYRSEYERVSKADYLATSKLNKYEDHTGEKGVTYYYAVAAVDEADNVGPLSATVVSTALPEKPLVTNTQQSFAADQLLEKVAKAILDLETTITTLEQEHDAEKILIIREAGLITKTQKLLATFTAGQTALQNSGALSEQEFNQRVTSLTDALTYVNEVIPTRISIDGNIAYTETQSAQAQATLISKATTIFGVDGRLLEDGSTRAGYQDGVQSLMDEVRVSVTLTTATILYADRSEKGITSISKQVVVPAHTEPYLLIEHTKGVISTDEATWDPQPILLDETMAQFTMAPGENELSYSYVIPRKIDLNTARTVKSVVLPSLETPVPASAVTGNVVLGGTEFHFSYLFGALVIAGLLVYYFFTDPAPKGLDQLTKVLMAMQQQTPKNSVRNHSYYRRPQSYFEHRKKSYFPSSRHAPSTQSLFPNTILPKILNVESPKAPLTLQELLQQGHQLIDQKEYIAARNLYEQALPDLKEKSPEQQANANLLYYKILLYRTVQAATRAAEEGNHEQLTEQLKTLKDVAQKVPESDSTLITHAKEEFRNLKRVANKLAIDQDSY